MKIHPPLHHVLVHFKLMYNDVYSLYTLKFDELQGIPFRRASQQDGCGSWRHPMS